MQDRGQGKKPLDVEFYERSQDQLRRLKSLLPSDTVEDLAREVIRRLAERGAAATVEAPDDARIELLCHALLSEDHHDGAAFIETVRSAGASVDSVYLRYLAGAARMLGRWWQEDLVSFADVTVATSRMYAIMRAVRHEFPDAPSNDRSAVFVTTPGENHTLGMRMAADLFRKDGWTIDLKIGRSHDELVAEIEHSGTRLIGISAGGTHAFTALSRLVIALRISNPHAAIFVGGNVVQDAPDAVSLIGVDGMAGDIKAAKAVMAALWDEGQRPD